MEAAFRVELTDREREVYTLSLKHIPADVIIPVTETCKQSWKPQFGVNFPPIADLLEMASRQRQRDIQQHTSEVITKREEKPPDWEPRQATSESESTFRAYARRSGIITQAEISEWFEGGKQAERDHIAILEANPDWQAMAARLGARPGNTTGQSISEQLTAQRNTKSTIPADPADRPAWARQKARDMGWVESQRQPGEEG